MNIYRYIGCIGTRTAGAGAPSVPLTTLRSTCSGLETVVQSRTPRDPTTRGTQQQLVGRKTDRLMMWKWLKKPGWGLERDCLQEGKYCMDKQPSALTYTGKYSTNYCTYTKVDDFRHATWDHQASPFVYRMYCTVLYCTVLYLSFDSSLGLDY
jgi:hypothetical protein